MKIKIVIILIIIASITYLIYRDPGLQQKLMNKFHQVAPELNKSTLYKWKNVRGEWQVTDKPPASGIPFTSISSKDQINVLQSPSTKKKNKTSR